VFHCPIISAGSTWPDGAVIPVTVEDLTCQPDSTQLPAVVTEIVGVVAFEVVT
jgi:hypothetical protein